VASSAARPPANAAIVAAARVGEPDRYVAALLSPAAARPHLLSLAAFLGEVRRAVMLVREPAMGEIRLQWWRQALALDADMHTGNPVADALREAAHACALPAVLVDGILDARALELSGDAGDATGRDSYLWKVEGAAFLLAGLILGGSQAALTPPAAVAGRAYGLARLLARPPARTTPAMADPLRAIAADCRADTIADARRHLAACRQQLGNLPRKVHAAFLPLALVGPYLRILERRADDVLRAGVTVAPLSRVARIAAAHWLHRI
jgi:15-cis-phytoene synthase